MSVVVVSSFLVGEGATTSRHHVQPVECDGPLDYFRGLLEVWESGDTLVNIEHDVEVSDDLIDELVACPEPACAFPYLIHHMRPEPFYGCANGPADWTGWSSFFARCTWVEPDTEWADFAAPGFIKLDPSVRRALGPECAWQGVELAVNEAVNVRWHLHWPAVDHYHQ